MWFRSKEEDAQRLHGEALEKLAEGDLDGARAIALELKAMRWSGAFEILALAARQAGDLEGAVASLDEGAIAAPTSWALHQLRGNLLDALGRHDDALRAFDVALACPEPWVSSIRYNRSVTRLAAGDPGGALEDATHVFEDPSSPPFGVDAVRVAADALAQLRREDDAVSLVRTAIGESAGNEQARGPLHALLARALSRAGRPLEEVRAACAVAVESGAGSAELAGWLEPPAADERPLRTIKLVAEGDLTTGPKRQPFLRVLVVACASPEEALDWARAIEPSAVRASMRIEKADDEGAADGPRGIRHATARIFFDE
jgi:tetratricopeptide (TPR) repeat protein